uniref:PA14 domain-containing protein n=1 Tax=Hanusia phi TaxID=3032 RepID=A0A7S0E7L5_9CRYP
MIKYYDECCGEQLKATYAGPDTWQIQELIPSASPQKPKLPAQSKWTMRLYSAPWNLQSVPDLAWVQFLGQATCPNVDFDRVEELDQYIANVPREDMVGAWYGKIEIRQAGSYDFCLSSNDGSKMYYDDQLIVDNDGPHGERKKCATLGDVKAGKHKVSILWFTNDANYAIRATYKGPDTFGSESFLGSTEEWAPAMVKQSKWHAWIYEYKNKRNTVPDFDSDELKLKEEGIVPFINFKSSSEWRTFLKNAPWNKVAWLIKGRVPVTKPGKYLVCSLSTYGSLVYIDNKMVVNNDGENKDKEICSFVTLETKTYDVVVKGYSDNSWMTQVLSYSGPDTDDKKVLMDANGDPATTKTDDK